MGIQNFPNPLFSEATVLSWTLEPYQSLVGSRYHSTLEFPLKNFASVDINTVSGDAISEEDRRKSRRFSPDEIIPSWLGESRRCSVKPLVCADPSIVRDTMASY